MRSSESSSGLAVVAAGLDSLAAVEVTELADAQVRAEVAALVEAGHRLQAELARRVGVFDDRGLARDDGARTTRAWLQSFTRVSGRVAHHLVKRARVLARFPRLLAAAQVGSVSSEHVGLVARLVDQVGRAGGGEVERADAVLADAAASLDLESFGLVCDRVRAHVDPDGPDPERAFASRGLALSPVAGSFVVRGQLDAEGGATVATALEALMAPPVDGDERTAAQRRADALVELARRSLVGGQLPTAGGQRPQVGVLLFPQSLSPALLRKLAAAQGDGPLVSWLGPRATASDGAASDGAASDGAASAFTAPDGAASANTAPDRAASASTVSASPTAASAASAATATATAAAAAAGGRIRALRPGAAPPSWSDPPFVDHIGPVSPVVAQRIACDADVWRLIIDPATGAPLDVGRSYRLVPHWIRRALHARDRGCRFPGCHTPSGWTDAHHLTPWAEGGATSADGCVLLCRHHHGLVHEGGWSIRMCADTGQVSVARPDGTPYLTVIESVLTDASVPTAGGGTPSRRTAPGRASSGNGPPGPPAGRRGPGGTASARQSHPWRGPSSRAA